jgi:hypothetical protein
VYLWAASMYRRELLMTLSILDISCVRAARWAARNRRTRSSSDSGRWPPAAPTREAAAAAVAMAGFPLGGAVVLAVAEVAGVDGALPVAEAVAADWELRAFPLACGVLAVNRVASATLRGVPSIAIGLSGCAFAGN